MAIRISFTVKSPLFIAAWIAYLLILFFWVRDDRAPKPLLIVDALLGLASVVGSLLVALLWAFPAIALMLHVTWRSFRATQPT